MSGDLLRTAVYANANTSYFATAGSGGGGSNISAQTITASTITVNQPLGDATGLTIESAGGPANALIQGLTSASLSLIGGEASIGIQGSTNGSLFVGTGNVIDAYNNTVQLEQRTNEETPDLSKVGMFIDGVNNYTPIIQMRHQNAVGEDAFVSVVGEITAGGTFLPSTMNIVLNDGSGNFLSGLTFDENGVTTGNMTITNLTLNNDLIVPNLTTGGYVRTEQPTGDDTGHQVRLFNQADIDLGQIFPMATVRNSTGGLEYATDSKIAQFGMMAPDSNYMTIPGTTYASACNVVLAPYTTLELYTGPMGSGGSTQYDNQGNAYFSTFTAEAYLNGNTFNSYKMFFGN